VLDVMLPGIDGHEVCRRIQRDRAVPVLMLTALDGETDLLVGLGIGADDYMTKPFSQRELVARVRALLRRAQGAAQPGSKPITAGPVTIDPERREVRRDGRLVHLTPTEFDLLHRLALRPGVVFNREQLLEEVWGYADGSAGARTVDSHVAAVRRKLGADVLRTVQGIGYAFGTPAIADP
jgi:DNA-binding response OmpR family regulator